MAKKIQSFYANGKLLLAGEYFVLSRAKSIALPVRFGQTLDVYPGDEDGIAGWEAYAQNRLWFSCRLKIPEFEIVESSDIRKAETLSLIFKKIHQLNPAIHFPRSVSFQTNMDFNPEWGFGSSSTLIYNLATWANVDPFQLNKLCFKGSGFDIACASADGSILYRQNKDMELIDLDYPFLDQLYFVYSGSKKRTLGDVTKFLKKNRISEVDLLKMNELIDQIASCKTLSEFQVLIREHEDLVSSQISVEPIKSQLFSDFNGELKSLGAWGGDFFLAAANDKENAVRRYFKGRGYDLIFKWDELVLKRKQE